MPPLYHLVQKGLWETAKASGQPYFPPTYQQDGFIHLTEDASYLLRIGNLFYRTVPGDFLLLVLDPSKLQAQVVFEAAAAVGSISSDGLTGSQTTMTGGSNDNATAPDEAAPAPAAAAPLFPHLYGTIDYEAVTQELVVERTPSGDFVSIVGL